MASAYPRYDLNGVLDEAGSAEAAVQENIPLHAPFVPFLASYGRTTTRFVTLDQFESLYGDETLNKRSKFYTHQSRAITALSDGGNAGFYAKRLVPADSSVAYWVLELEMVAHDVPEYERSVAGAVNVDVQTGAKVEVVGGTANPGYLCRLQLRSVTSETEYLDANTRAGDLVGSKGLGTASVIYPLWGCKTLVGAEGNKRGMTLEVPLTGTSGIDTDLMLDQMSMMVRIGMFKINSVGTVKRVKTINGENTVDYALDADAYNPEYDNDLYLNLLMPRYNNDNPGTVPVDGPFVDMNINQGNIDTVRTLLHTAEAAAPGHIEWEGTEKDFRLANFFTAINYDGTEAYAYEMSDDSLAVDGSTVHYATGGSDGTIEDGTYDTLVADLFSNEWEDSDEPLRDMLKYKFSDIYDTGFSTTVKSLMPALLGRRKNLFVHMAMFLDGKDELTQVEAESLAATLNAKLALAPESTLHGTKAYRGTIHGHAMEEVGGTYREKVTPILDFITKESRFRGAANGKCKVQYLYERGSLANIDGLKNAKGLWKTEATRIREWDANMITLYNKDGNTVFRPACQTAYSDSTSPLNGWFFGRICADIQTKFAELWADWSGVSTLTNEQLKNKLETEFKRKLDGVYGTLVTIVPEVRFTPTQEENNYEYTMDAAVYGNTMKTVGVFNVIARQMRDLTE